MYRIGVFSMGEPMAIWAYVGVRWVGLVTGCILGASEKEAWEEIPELSK
jgi:hypothetical protein